jgi:hypothetical protein
MVLHQMQHARFMRRRQGTTGEGHGTIAQQDHHEQAAV